MIGSSNNPRSGEHTSELQSLRPLVCRLLLEKKKKQSPNRFARINQARSLRAHHTALHAWTRPSCAAPVPRVWLRGTTLRVVYCFFFNDTATTEIYTLSLHDALPI